MVPWNGINSGSTVMDESQRAMADETRLRILLLLIDGELCVCEIIAALELPQSTVSRHLSLLRQVGIVGARRSSGQHFYRLRVRCLDGFWQCVEGVLANQAAEHDELTSAERVALIRPDTLKRPS